VSSSVDNLDLAWQSIDGLCSTFTDDEWPRSTGCPGWTVQDVLAHLVDYEARALGRAAPDHTPHDLSHTRNDMGRHNEIGVDSRRQHSGHEVLEEFREVTARRLEQMRAWTGADLASETMTPAGPGTVADMLRLRVMDTWSHEQDMRRALDRPGATEGPVADEAIAYFTNLLPYVVGKRAGAPDGASVVFDMGPGRIVRIDVNGGRARLADAREAPASVTIAMPATTFAALVGGRDDAPADVAITGDESLGRSIVGSLTLMP
jgi:uncharacterized protein (TIGR03083 family)